VFFNVAVGDPFGEFGRVVFYICHWFEFKHPLPRSSTPNCPWPPGWDLAGERARPGGRFRRRARPKRRRRGIFVEPQPKKLNPSPAFGILSHPLGEEPSPVGAASSLTIAQPFKAGIHRAQTSKSRQGRQTISFVPDGTRTFAGQFTQP
jgi:hypothetical protein